MDNRTFVETVYVVLMVAAPLSVLVGFALLFWIPPRRAKQGTDEPASPSSDE